MLVTFLVLRQYYSSVPHNSSFNKYLHSFTTVHIATPCPSTGYAVTLLGDKCYFSGNVNLNVII
jgi:hypothetical protein